jgi:hypothetical protein
VERNLSQYLFIHHMSHIDCLGLNPAICDERPSNNRIGHYTAQKLCKNCIQNGVVNLEFIYSLLSCIVIVSFKFCDSFQVEQTVFEPKKMHLPILH